MSPKQLHPVPVKHLIFEMKYYVFFPNCSGSPGSCVGLFVTCFALPLSSLYIYISPEMLNPRLLLDSGGLLS